MIGTVSPVCGPDSTFNSNNLPWWRNGLVNVLVCGAIIFSQVYRYRRVSNRVERQQTKWVVLGIIVVLTGIFVVLPIFTFFFPVLTQPNTLASTIIGMAYPLVLLLIPVTAALSLLPSRFYVATVLIN